MNIATFLGHYQISENPFRAEEARHDSVFSRVETACHHPDYEKIRGDFTQPATAIVFGERGSGKTAIRLQIEDELAAHNATHPEQRCLPIIYDELNPVLDRFARQRGGKALRWMRSSRFELVDHIDAMMSSIVPRVVDQALGDARRRHADVISAIMAGGHFGNSTRGAARPHGAADVLRPSRRGRIAHRAPEARDSLPFVQRASAVDVAERGDVPAVRRSVASTCCSGNQQEQLWLWYAAIGVTARSRSSALRARGVAVAARAMASARDLARSLACSIARPSRFATVAAPCEPERPASAWACRAATMTIFATRCSAGC